MRGWRIAIVGVGAAVLSGVLAPAALAASTGGASDKEIAASGVLVAGDLPATYTQSARDTSSDAGTTKLAATIPACKKLVAFRKAVDKYPEAKSDDFGKDQIAIDNTVTVFPNEATAKAAVDTYAASGVPQCFGKLVDKLAQRAGGTTKSDIKKVKNLTAGDQAVAYEGPVGITEADGSKSLLGFGNLVIRIGRGVAVYSYNHDAQTDISTELNSAVSASGKRLQTALGR